MSPYDTVWMVIQPLLEYFPREIISFLIHLLESIYALKVYLFVEKLIICLLYATSYLSSNLIIKLRWLDLIVRKYSSIYQDLVKCHGKISIK